MKKKTVDPWKKAKTYVGIKIIQAAPMSLGDYNDYRSWTQPDNEDPKAAGCIVKYPDGYISWSPKGEFDVAYMTTDALSFGAAIYLMKRGYKVARAGWNGKGMWCIYVPGTAKCPLRPGTPYAEALPKRKQVDILPHFDMYTINSNGRRAMLPGWLASQSDMDAEDWCIVK